MMNSKNKFNINILAPGQKKSIYPTSQKILLFLIPLFTWIVMVVGFYLFLYRPTCEEAQRQQQNLGELDRELARLNDVHHNLEKRQALYLQASGEGIDWSSKLLSFGLMIPKDIWITKLIFAKNEKSKDTSCLLDIYGQTISTSHKESLDKIAIFMEKMNEVPSFRQEFLPLEFMYSQLNDEKNWIMDFKLTSPAKILQGEDGH